MRSEDSGAARASLDRAIAAHPAQPGLHLLKSHVLEYTGGEARVYSELTGGLAQATPCAAIEVVAARAALRLDPVRALAHARAAMALQPSDDAETALCETLLATGEAEQAAAVAARLLRRRPLDQHLLAYQLTAWRLLDDPRRAALLDYPALVRSYKLEPPSGWSSLEDYLNDLRTSLSRLHVVRGHPLGQSVRGGSQTMTDLQGSEDAVVQAFFRAIDDPIRRYISTIGKGDDVFRSRNHGGHHVDGAWSVRLRPGAGRHVDHVHQNGWISSACYVALPAAVDAGGEQGWIKFGEPGVPTQPPLTHEYAVKPAPGLLVLFPSYMWHGTIPFAGESPRLTVAFDLRPGRRG